MSRHEQSIPPAYFNDLYDKDPDPWRFAESDYERDKYAETIGALPKQKYRSVLEVGCSIGVLTSQLAPRCEALLSIDVAGAPLAQAEMRCRQWPHVRFEQLRVPDEWPSGRFDLILLSEVVYYLDQNDVRALAQAVGNSISDRADLVLVHWLGETHYPLSGDEAAELFIASSASYLRVVEQKRTDRYRLDVLFASTAGLDLERP